MITATFETSLFTKMMNNIVDYSIGFTEGVQKGKPRLLSSLADEAISILEEYLDASARVDPASLAHVYEWDNSGNSSARLFELNKMVSKNKVKIFANLLTSQSIKDGSKEPFYDKATIMERGIPVVIKPKTSSVLAFDQNGETIFTSKEVSVQDPGGAAAEGGFQKAFSSFFDGFASQAILSSGNIANFLKNPTDYSRNLRAGSVGGKMIGISTGYNWISRAGGMID